MVPVQLISGALTAGAAAALAGYHSLAPSSQLYGKSFRGTRGSGRKLALTYDDGPNDPDTLRLLDVLAKHDVKATFFVIGKYVEQRPDIVRRIVEAGHAIGNHTYSHPNLAFCSRRRLLSEILMCDVALEIASSENYKALTELRKSAAGSRSKFDDFSEMLANIKATTWQKDTKLFRPPFGARRPGTFKFAHSIGFTAVMWTVMCYDWKSTTADRVERHARKQIHSRGGDIILMHDGGHKQFGANRQHTVEATDRIIQRYKDRGFEFVTVHGMW